MLHELTPDQRAKLARGWVWQEGHLPARCKARISIVEPEGDICVDDPERDYWFAKDELVPDLDDPVTRDGLLRTARAAWQNPRLHAQPLWDFDEPDKIARWDIHGAPRCAGKTEEAALLAAILAAPEAK